MKLAIITSSHLRHKYFVSTLAKTFNVIGLIIEEKKRDPTKKGEGTELESRVKDYFGERDKSEKIFFGNIDWEDTQNKIGEIVNVIAGEINQQINIDLLKRWNPDFISVFGSSILGEKIIELFPNRIINMHLGLSPFYRGSGTNFWPLYDEKPEYVGVTIHYLDKGIDTGNVIVQGRPSIESGDTPHSIGNKTIIEGVRLMKETLKRFEKGELVEGFKQDKSIGRLCLFNDCKPEHIIELKEKFDNGLIERYLNRIGKK